MSENVVSLNVLSNAIVSYLDTFGMLIALGVGLSLLSRIMIFIFGAASSPYQSGESERDSRPYPLRKFDSLVEEITEFAPKDPIITKLPKWRESVKKLSILSTQEAEEFVVSILENLDKVNEQLKTAHSLKEIAKTKDVYEEIKEQNLRANDQLQALIEVKFSDQER